MSVRSDSPIPPAALGWEECIQLLNRIPGLPLDERRAAIERLGRNSSLWIRQRALHMGAALLPDHQLVEYLRNEADDVLRNIGLEILKIKGPKAFDLAVTLLEDDDPDVVLQAILILDTLRDPRALEPLRAILGHTDPNIVQADIVAVGKIGDERVIPDLVRFLVADPWLQMAAIQALGDLRSSKAVRHLKRFLPDLMVGMLAAEAMARIGGKAVFDILARHWLQYRDQLDPEPMLGFVAHVAEGLSTSIPKVSGLPEAVAALLEEDTPCRTTAAKLLVILGDEGHFSKALEVLNGASGLSTHPPVCLHRRLELLPRFLEFPGPLFPWGLRLAQRNAQRLREADMRLMLNNPDAPESLDLIGPILAQSPVGTMGEILLDFYLHLTPSARSRLVPALLRHRSNVLAAMEERTDLDPGLLLLLRALLRGGGPRMALELSVLPPDRLGEAVEHLAGRPDLLRRLPWPSLIAADAEGYSSVAARVVVAAGLQELAPVLRDALRKHPQPDLIRVLGELRDRECLPILEGLLDGPNPFLKALVLETLGTIGGPEAREILKRILADPAAQDLKLIYRSLAHCAILEDAPIFREAASHPDWMVRLASAEMLGRFPASENLAVLMTLTSDPVGIVAQRAAALLEP